MSIVPEVDKHARYGEWLELAKRILADQHSGARERELAAAFLTVADSIAVVHNHLFETNEALDTAVEALKEANRGMP